MQSPGATLARRLAQRTRLISGQHESLLVDGSGQPPEHVRAAAAAALDDGHTHYTVGPGIQPLREAIAARSTADGFPATADSVVVTNGGSEALYIALQSVLRPEDRIALAGPVAPNVREMIAFIGATPLALPADEGARFTATSDAIAASGATTLLLASPSPITGMLVPAPEMKRMIATALDRGMAVIVDRTLAWCCFEPDAARITDADLGARVLTTGSFSDAYAMHGWRAGYFTAPAEHLADMRDLKLSMSICTSTMSQYAALAALEGPAGWLEQRRRAFVAARERLTSRCAEMGVTLLTADAWPPVLLRAPEAFDATRLADALGIPVEPAERYGAALGGLFRARLSVGEGNGA